MVIAVNAIFVIYFGCAIVNQVGSSVSSLFENLSPLVSSLTSICKLLASLVCKLVCPHFVNNLLPYSGQLDVYSLCKNFDPFFIVCVT